MGYTTFSDTPISKPTNMGGKIPEMSLAPCHSGPAQPLVPCDDGHGHCKLLEYQAAIRITIRELSRRKATECCSITQYHVELQLEKTLKSNCFNLKVFVGKISCISSTVLVSITHDVSSTDACQMNESSCTGRPLLSKISRLRAGQFHNWQSYRNSSMASKCFKQSGTAGIQCIQWVEWQSSGCHASYMCRTSLEKLYC